MSAKSRQVGGSHYRAMKIQPVDFCESNGLGYCQSLAIRYIVRYKQKDGKKDLLKAIHCLELLLERYKT